MTETGGLDPQDSLSSSQWAKQEVLNISKTPFDMQHFSLVLHTTL